MADIATPTVAQNIAQGISDKASGKAPVPDQGGTPAIDPNAGKEKYVVDGKDVWVTPEQRAAWIQKGMAFEPKVTQLAKLQSETGAFLEALKADPMKILTDKRIGHNPKAVLERVLGMEGLGDDVKEMLGEWYFKNVVQPLKMTPEERRLSELEKENSKFKSEKQQIEENRIKAENKQRFDAALNQLKANVAEAMNESGLPSNDTPLGAEMARMVADAMRVAYFQRKVITPKQAIEQVRSRIKSVQASYYDHLDGEALVKELGEANTEKVKKYLLKLVKAVDPVQKKMPSTPRGERQTLSRDDFFDQLAELKKENKPTRF